MPEPSPWSDLDRAPMSAARLSRAVIGNGLWTELRLLRLTASTMAEAAQAARAGADEGLVVVAEEQTAGRGRLERQWSAPPRSSVLLSALLRPTVPPASLPLLPLLAGLAAAEAVRSVTRLDAVLKWPNDVLVADRKLGGLLVERVDGAAVVGIGLNVSLRSHELPVPTATSVTLAGGQPDREALVKELLRALARRYLAWQASGGGSDLVVPAFREVCATIGRRVVVHLPDDAQVHGMATGVDDHGRLEVRDDAGVTGSWSAGDVVHVRGEA